MKICSTCKKEKDESEFYPRKNCKIGLIPTCIPCSKIKTDEYYALNKEKYRRVRRRYYKNNKEKYDRTTSKLVEKYRLKWIEYFKKRYKEVPICQICGKELKWCKDGNIMEVVNFDHKKRNLLIKTPPTTFIYTHSCSPENIATWEQCNFGILCRSCNSHLRTDHRIEWLKSALRYAEEG